jgi:thiamine biosynthesis lipoprotein ApbE
MVASDRWETAEGWCEVFTSRAEDLPLVSDIAREKVESLGQACSPQRPDSEINGLSGAGPREVSQQLSQAVAAALRATLFSQGLVPTTAAVTAPISISESKQTAAGSAELVLDECTGVLTLPPQLELTLWPIAKAWCADQIAEACQRQLGVGTLVNLGGDIAARGEPPEGGWQIRIDDGQPSPTGSQTITMGWSGGLASVSTEAPHWPVPAGQVPAAPRHWRSVSVAAHSCERAKAASLAALILADSAPRWLTQRELPARLVHIGGVAVQTPGWPSTNEARG